VLLLALVVLAGQTLEAEAVEAVAMVDQLLAVAQVDQGL
jgi:hypothetical protein